jgi:hypothetical protein
MSFSNTTETAILNYLGPGTAPSWAGAATFYFAAHTADPGDTGTAVTSEVSGIGDYARVAVTRATGLSVSGNTLSNVNLVQFPIGASGGPVTITHVSLVDTASGAGTILFRCELADTIPYQTGIQPQIAATALTFSLD